MTASMYPSYKDVPIPWVASIPEHWDWKPVLGVASERDEDNKGMKEDNLLSLSYGNIVNKDINTSDGLLPESFETYQIVRPGDIVLRLTDLQNDKRSLRSALVTQTGIITSAYLALKPESIDPKYLGYLLRAYDVSKVFYSMGGGLRQSMKYGDIKRMPLVIPTKAEQLSIATFLDRETAKIDALIAEQQRLIELLQEKRQAVISHAVTKGLSPNAPMKDSGVEWLGEVPEHWEVKKIKHVGTIRYGIGEPPEYKEQGVPLIRATNVCSGEISEDNMAYVDPVDIPAKRIIWLKEGDIIVVRSGALTGDSAIIKSEYAGSIAGFDMVLACTEVMPVFAQYCLLSPELKAAQIDISKQRAAQPHLNSEELGQCLIAMPPSAEQREICDYLDRELLDCKSLIDQSLSLTELLRERRSALISAAVTGQIDVRGLVEAEVGE